LARKAKEEMDETERRAIALQEAEELASAQLASLEAQSGGHGGGGDSGAD
jgi:DNA-directed RNA polymerase subunit beta'